MALICRQLDLSTSGYYAWRQRKPSRRAKEDAVLVGKIAQSHRESRGTYGSPRIQDDLKDQGFEVGRRRVARLMKENGITGAPPRVVKVTTDSNHDFGVAENVLQRDFNPKAPDMA